MSIYSSACKHNIRLQFINLGCVQLNYKSFKTYLIRCTVGFFTFLFTIRLVNFIKFADYFHLVAVNTYFYLIHNNLVFLGHGQWCFTPSNFQSSLSSLLKPKQLDFLLKIIFVCVYLSDVKISSLRNM